MLFTATLCQRSLMGAAHWMSIVFGGMVLMACALALSATRERWQLPCCLAAAALEPRWGGHFLASTASSLVLGWFALSFVVAAATSYVG